MEKIFHKTKKIFIVALWLIIFLGSISYVRAAILVDIKVEKNPKKTDYFVGQNFEKNGMVVKAIYIVKDIGNRSSNSKLKLISKEIKNYTILNGKKLSLNQESVTVSYKEKDLGGIEIIKSTNVKINVKENIMTVASRIWKKICKEGDKWNYGSSYLPNNNYLKNKKHYVDCSGYVSWVLYEMGYKSEFSKDKNNRYKQHVVRNFYRNDYTKKYGWQQIYFSKEKKNNNPINILRPGDIFMRTTNSDKDKSGHMCIIAEIIKDENGTKIGIKAFDCGDKSRWINNKKGKLYDATWMLTDSRYGKIIRLR